MRAVLTVVRVVGLRRARCGRGGQRTRATLTRAPSATALAHRTHTYNSPAIRPTRHHTCTTPTHAYTHPHRHHHDLRNIQRRHVGAALRHRLDRLVCQLPATPARRACVDGTAVREANERGQREETRQGARTDRYVRTPPHAQQRVALPMRAVLTVVRVVVLRRGRCGRQERRKVPSYETLT